MSRRRAAIAAACAAFLTAAAPGVAAQPAPQQLVLRLADLAPGSGVSDGSGCSSRQLRDDATRLGLGDVARLPHHGCDIAFEPLWSLPGSPRPPAFVGSTAFVFEDATGPQLALARPRALAAYVTASTRGDLEIVEPSPAIGDQAVLLHDRPGFTGYVVWRSGTVLGIVGASFANGLGDSVTAAVQLATAQQARIATPTPLLPGDFDDVEVPLDDPHIDVPVVWVGRELDGRPPLPRVRLQSVEPSSLRDHRYGLVAAMTYGPRDEVTAFQLTLYRPSAFARPALRRELSRLRRDRCVHTERIPLADGSATLYASRRGCRARGLDGPVALVRLPSVRVAVLPDYGCADCTDVVTRWASAAGVRAVIRALHPREPRPAAPAP